MKLERLLEMTMLLMNREQMTATQLAERFGVSKRTIYRDIDALSLAGIPVYASKGRGGGIGLLPEYTLQKSIVSEEERKEILIGLQSLKATDYPTDSALIEKLRSLFKSEKNFDWLEVDFTEWGKGEEDRERFEGIRDAVVERRVLRFLYANSYGKQSMRTVEPLKLIYKARAWYLRAWCRDKQGYRLFRLSRIKRLSISQETFQPRLDTPERDEAPRFVMREFVIYFSPQIAYRVYDEFRDMAIRPLEDGGMEVRTVMPLDEWIFGYLLSFGDMAELISPADVKEELAKRIARMHEKYK